MSRLGAECHSACPCVMTGKLRTVCPPYLASQVCSPCSVFPGLSAVYRVPRCVRRPLCLSIQGVSAVPGPPGMSVKPRVPQVCPPYHVSQVCRHTRAPRCVRRTGLSRCVRLTRPHRCVRQTQGSQVCPPFNSIYANPVGQRLQFPIKGSLF
jgi:hypothetical protein